MLQSTKVFISHNSKFCYFSRKMPKLWVKHFLRGMNTFVHGNVEYLSFLQKGNHNYWTYVSLQSNIHVLPQNSSNVDFSPPKFDPVSIKHKVWHFGWKTCIADLMSTTVPPTSSDNPAPFLQYSKHPGISRAERKTRRARRNVPICRAITLPFLFKTYQTLGGCPLCGCHFPFHVSCTFQKIFSAFLFWGDTLYASSDEKYNV